MLTAIYVACWLIAAFGVKVLWQFWRTIDRLGYVREVSRRASAFYERNLFAFAAALTLPVTLPIDPAWMRPLLAVSCLIAGLYGIWQTIPWLAVSKLKAVEKSVRFLYALDIVTDDDLMYALKTIQQYKAERAALR